MKNKKELQLKLIALKEQVRRDFPYLGAGLWAMVPVLSPGLAAQNGSGWASDEYGRFYVDPECLDHPLAVRKAALKHEHGHIWGEHFTRARNVGCAFSGPLRRLTNIAADLEMHGNDPYYRTGFRSADSPLSGIFPEDLELPNGKVFEEYLALLLKKQEEREKKKGKEPGDEDGQPGEPGEPGNGPPTPGQPGGEGGSGEEPFPEMGHDCGSGAGPGEERPWELGKPTEEDPGLDGQQQDQVRRKMAQDITKAEKEGKLTRGDSGSFWMKWAEEIIPPHTVSWEEKLPQLATTAAAMSPGYEDYSFLQSSRRDYGEVVMPGMFEIVLRITFIRDVSSSMSDRAVKAGNKEAEGILNTVADELTVIDCDTQAENHGAVFSMRELGGRGHGGTDLREAFKMVQNADEQPHVIVCWTDGGTPWPSVAPSVPVLVCLVGETEWARASPDSLPSWAHVLEVPI